MESIPGCLNVEIIQAQVNTLLLAETIRVNICCELVSKTRLFIAYAAKKEVPAQVYLAVLNVQHLMFYSRPTVSNGMNLRADNLTGDKA